MVKIWENPNGQRFVTIPKPISEAMGLTHGQEISWTVQGKGKLLLELVKKTSTPKTQRGFVDEHK